MARARQRDRGETQNKYKAYESLCLTHAGKKGREHFDLLKGGITFWIPFFFLYISQSHSELDSGT